MESVTGTADIIKTLVAIVEEKDRHLRGHAERVAATCARFSKKIGMSDAVETISLAALLHDIGMIFLPRELLEHTEAFSEDEMAVVRHHPVIAERIVANLKTLNEVLPVIRSHHEAYDGSGYPDGLTGDAIPKLARILSLADAYHAMTAQRSHRRARSTADALEQIRQRSGSVYDPELTGRFVEFIQSDTRISAPAPAKTENAESNTAALNTVITKIMLQFRQQNIELPVLPQIIQEAETIISSPNASADDLAQVIERDAVITFRLLAVANSPVYRGTDKITTIRQAVLRLGMQESRNIIAAIATKSIYGTGHPQFKLLLEKMWLHSLACGYAARALAGKLQEKNKETFFLLGLLHDIGKPLLVNALTAELENLDRYETGTVAHSIQEVHRRFGSILLLRWGFPREYVRVAEQHENEDVNPGARREVLIVNLANNLTRAIGCSMFDEPDLEPAGLASATLLGVDAAAIDHVREIVCYLMQETATMF